MSAPDSSMTQGPASGDPEYEPLRADLEAILTDLLLRFRDHDRHDDDEVARFAQAGTEALLTEIRNRPWLSGAEGAALLGIDEATLRQRGARRELPVARDSQGLPRVHRRDVSLVRLSQRLGATEGQWTPLVSPVAWSEELTAQGFNPWDETTPG